MSAKFGSCCSDLADAMNEPENSMFRLEKNGVFYLSVGYIETPQGPAWLDQAVLFCPFCGTKLQDAKKIAESADA